MDNDTVNAPGSLNQADAQAWHTLSAEAAARILAVDPVDGLSGQEAARRLQRFGPNALHEKPPRPAWRLLLDQFSDFMILVLLGAVVVSGLVGDLKDTIAIVVIILLNATIGSVQEWRAERAVAALRSMSASHATALRDGKPEQVAATELVPGDVVLLEAGNLVPADLRLIEAHQLKLDEAMLTGEAVTAEKHAAMTAEAGLPLGERFNMAFKGTVVTNGRASGVVVATGMATELGRIATMLDSGETLKTPLQQRLAAFGKRLGLAVLGICAVIFVVGLLRGEEPGLMFLTAVSLAVAAIPEALPAVVTISLALGARKMVQQHALVRRLPAVETLGSVTWICSDKTGTLTQNKMRVQVIEADQIRLEDMTAAPPRPPWSTLFAALALCNDATSGRHGHVAGDPTEVALYQAAHAAGYDKATLQKTAPRLLELPFDSERKCMTTFHRHEDQLLALTKGAPEQVIARCVGVITSGGVQALDQAAVSAAVRRMAEQGLRVLAVARRDWAELPRHADPAVIESELLLLGLVGLIDPPRSEAKSAVRMCRSAGITPVMITGDHAATAFAIARELGIASDRASVLTGPQLAALDDDEFRGRVESLRVYARVDPAQKIRIVEALQAHGQFVAMTGDGVNDAPALRRADIGIAMGKEGTDVAREAASLVLLDDNFATIVHAVREGRRIYDNIRKFIRYAMTGNSAEIWVIFLAPLLGLPIPLLPIHILWVNLLTDGLPGLALTAEPAERGIMQRPPRPPGESVFAHGMWQHIVWVGLVIAGVSLFAQAWAIHVGSAHWRSMVFTVLTLAQLAHVAAIRSERLSLFARGVGRNLPLAAALLITVALQMATLYVPLLQPVFGTAPLSPAELGLCLLLAGLVIPAVELEKLLARKGLLYREA